MSNLYLICGMSGSGKTTLAKKLESTISTVRLCGDELIIGLWIAPSKIRTIRSKFNTGDKNL